MDKNTNKKTFENFFVDNSNLNALKKCMVAVHSPQHSDSPILIYGDSGRGKTHLLKAVKHEAHTYYPQKKVMYINAEDIVSMWTNSIENKNDAQTEQLLDEMYSSIDLLLIDNFRFVAQLDATLKMFLSLIRVRCEKELVTIISVGEISPDLFRLIRQINKQFPNCSQVYIDRPLSELRLSYVKMIVQQCEATLSDETAQYLSQLSYLSLPQLRGLVLRVLFYENATGEKATKNWIDDQIK